MLWYPCGGDEGREERVVKILGLNPNRTVPQEQRKDGQRGETESEQKEKNLDKVVTRTHPEANEGNYSKGKEKVVVRKRQENIAGGWSEIQDDCCRWGPYTHLYVNI